jgi:hypothetical protein
MENQSLADLLSIQPLRYVDFIEEQWSKVNLLKANYHDQGDEPNNLLVSSCTPCASKEVSMTSKGCAHL